MVSALNRQSNVNQCPSVRHLVGQLFNGVGIYASDVGSPRWRFRLMVRLSHHVISEFLPTMDVGLYKVLIDAFLGYERVDARQHEGNVGARPNWLPPRFNLGVDVIAERSDI